MLERAYGAGPSPVASAVLVPVYWDEAGEMRVVLVVRGEHGRHGGQIALDPGGVEILATLPEVDTTTGYVITPFLAREIGDCHR